MFLQPDGASSVVVAGSNAAWPAQAIAQMPGSSRACARRGGGDAAEEVPSTNAAVAAAAASAGVPVLQDVGGEDRPIASELLPLLSYLLPNETELADSVVCRPHRGGGARRRAGAAGARRTRRVGDPWRQRRAAADRGR